MSGAAALEQPATGVCVPVDDSLLGVAEAGCDMTERVVVAKCYSKIETSTSQNQIRK